MRRKEGRVRCALSSWLRPLRTTLSGSGALRGFVVVELDPGQCVWWGAMSGRPLSPPSRRRRKKVGFVDDSEESQWQPPQPSVDRGLETVRVAAAARGTSKLGAASLGPGRSTASGTSSSYEMIEMVEGSPSPAWNSPEPDRCHQLGADVHGDVGRDGEGHERGWTWTADQDWWSYSGRDHAIGIPGMSGIRILGVLLPGPRGAGPLLLGRHGHGALGMKGQGLHTTCHQWPMRKHITMGTPAHWAGGTAGRDAW